MRKTWTWILLTLGVVGASCWLYGFLFVEDGWAWFGGIMVAVATAAIVAYLVGKAFNPATKVALVGALTVFCFAGKHPIAFHWISWALSGLFLALEFSILSPDLSFKYFHLVFSCCLGSVFCSIPCYYFVIFCQELGDEIRRQQRENSP